MDGQKEFIANIDLNLIHSHESSFFLTLLVRGGLIQPPLRNIALNQVIWGPGPPKLIDFS